MMLYLHTVPTGDSTDLTSQARNSNRITAQILDEDILMIELINPEDQRKICDCDAPLSKIVPENSSILFCKDAIYRVKCVSHRCDSCGRINGYLTWDASVLTSLLVMSCTYDVLTYRFIFQIRRCWGLHYQCE